MLLKATKPAAYSVSPSASLFQTITIAIHLAIPINIKPIIYSGYPRRKMIASENIRIGPIIQFWTKDKTRILKSRNTSKSSSYFTFANGGYIINISPRAIGILVVPTWKRLINNSMPGTKYPIATPIAIARKIQSVKNRSRNKKQRLILCPNYPSTTSTCAANAL